MSTTGSERPGAVSVPSTNIRTSHRPNHLRQRQLRYDPNRLTLTNINLDITAGQTVALSDDTGAGKSTLVSLIPRFFDPTTGTVAYDGTDLRNLRLTSLRNRVSLVLQDPFLLPLTIGENIAYGRPDAPTTRIIAAAKAANAHDFITALPDGYETTVGEHGATLYRRRAPTHLHRPSPPKKRPGPTPRQPTSALDTHTETALLEALKRLMAGRTTFIIAHRPSPPSAPPTSSASSTTAASSKPEPTNNSSTTKGPITPSKPQPPNSEPKHHEHGPRPTGPPRRLVQLRRDGCDGR